MEGIFFVSLLFRRLYDLPLHININHILSYNVEDAAPFAMLCVYTFFSTGRTIKTKNMVQMTLVICDSIISNNRFSRKENLIFVLT